MFFSKKKHPLPKFPPGIKSAVKNLSYPLSKEDLQQVEASIADTSSALLEQATDNSLIDKNLVLRLQETARLLLEQYRQQSSQKSQNLIAAALRYFVSDDDFVAEGSFATGLHDDAKVMNHVLEEIGVEGQYIELNERW